MILLNGKRYAIDTPFTDENGTQYPSNWYRVATPEQRIAVGFTEIPDPPPIDERFYYINSDGTVSEKPLENCKQIYMTQLANIRWGFESKGIVYSNTVFATDQQSRVNYLGAFIQATTNPEFTVQWKAKNLEDEPVFVTLNSNDVIVIVNSGTDYISNCFSCEENFRQQIQSANSLNEMLTIDINSNWPQNKY